MWTPHRRPAWAARSIAGEPRRCSPRRASRSMHRRHAACQLRRRKECPAGPAGSRSRSAATPPPANCGAGGAVLRDRRGAGAIRCRAGELRRRKVPDRRGTSAVPQSLPARPTVRSGGRRLPAAAGAPSEARSTGRLIPLFGLFNRLRLLDTLWPTIGHPWGWARHSGTGALTLWRRSSGGGSRIRLRRRFCRVGLDNRRRGSGGRGRSSGTCAGAGRRCTGCLRAGCRCSGCGAANGGSVG